MFFSVLRFRPLELWNWKWYWKRYSACATHRRMWRRRWCVRWWKTWISDCSENEWRNRKKICDALYFYKQTGDWTCRRTSCRWTFVRL